MIIVILRMLKHYLNRKVIVYDENILNNSIEFINRIGTTIQKYLELGNLENIPFIQFCEEFDNPEVYGLYKFDTKEIFISVKSLIKTYKCRNYADLFINLGGAIIHELTHYKQDIEGRYSYEKFVNEYRHINDYSMNEYISQEIEQEAFKNQIEYMQDKDIRKLTYKLAGIILVRRFKKK